MIYLLFHAWGCFAFVDSPSHFIWRCPLAILFELKLDLTSNHIGPDGALAIGFALGKNRSLRRLVLRHNLSGDVGCAAICNPLTSRDAVLQQLNLAANGLTSESARSIGRLIAADTPLLEIDVSCNAFGEVYHTPTAVFSVIIRYSGLRSRANKDRDLLI